MSASTGEVSARVVLRMALACPELRFSHHCRRTGRWSQGPDNSVEAGSGGDRPGLQLRGRFKQNADPAKDEAGRIIAGAGVAATWVDCLFTVSFGPGRSGLRRAGERGNGRPADSAPFDTRQHRLPRHDIRLRLRQRLGQRLLRSH